MRLGGGGDGDPAADVRVAADDGARGLRERDDPRRPLERFEAARDLRLLHGQALGGEGVVRFGAQRVADVEQPAVERGEARAAVGAGVEMRMALARTSRGARTRWSLR